MARTYWPKGPLASPWFPEKNSEVEDWGTGLFNTQKSFIKKTGPFYKKKQVTKLTLISSMLHWSFIPSCHLTAGLCSAQTVHVVWSGWVIVWEVITHSKSINIYFSILIQMSCVMKSVWFLTQKSSNFMKTHFLMEIAAFYKKSPLSYKKTHMAYL